MLAVGAFDKDGANPVETAKELVISQPW